MRWISGRLNSAFVVFYTRVIDIQTGLLDPEDWFLISMESLIVIGLLIAAMLAYRVTKRYPKLTSHGWSIIILGIVFLIIHSVADVLDTLHFDDLIVDLLNVVDGATFVLGLVLFAIGIYQIAMFGAKQWRL
mgnify:CR=1 FL=1